MRFNAVAAELAGFFVHQKQAGAEVARLLTQMTIEGKLLKLLAYKPNGVAWLPPTKESFRTLARPDQAYFPGFL